VVTAAEWEEVGFVSNLSRDFLLYTDTVIKNALGTHLKVVLVVNRLWWYLFTTTVLRKFCTNYRFTGYSKL